MAEKYRVDVVISASGLKCLMDNSAPVYQQSWELPIVVREHTVEGNECSLANIMWLLLHTRVLHRRFSLANGKSLVLQQTYPRLFQLFNHIREHSAVQKLNLKLGKLDLYVSFCSILFCIMMSFYDVMFSTGHAANKSGFWIM